MVSNTTSVLNGLITTGHVGLNVTNLQRSKEFYQSVFGLQVVSESNTPGRLFALLGDGKRMVLTLWQQSGEGFNKSQAGLHHLSFEVASAEVVATAERRLRELNVPLLYDGAVAHREGADSGGIFFTDPDGIRLEIYAPAGMSGQPAPQSDGPACGFF